MQLGEPKMEHSFIKRERIGAMSLQNPQLGFECLNEFDFNRVDSSQLFEGLEEFASHTQSRAASRMPSVHDDPVTASVDAAADRSLPEYLISCLAAPRVGNPTGGFLHQQHQQQQQHQIHQQHSQPVCEKTSPPQAHHPARRHKRRSNASDYVMEAGSDASNDSDSEYHDDNNDDEIPVPQTARDDSADSFIGLVDLNAPLTTIVDLEEGKKLEQKLLILQSKMSIESKRLKGLDSCDRKRKRNRMASQISRLRKKLVVYELQRRYIESCQSNRSLLNENQLLRDQVSAMTTDMQMLREQLQNFTTNTTNNTNINNNDTEILREQLQVLANDNQLLRDQLQTIINQKSNVLDL